MRPIMLARTRCCSAATIEPIGPRKRRSSNARAATSSASIEAGLGATPGTCAVIFARNRSTVGALPLLNVLGEAPDIAHTAFRDDGCQTGRQHRVARAAIFPRRRRQAVGKRASGLARVDG